MTFSTEPINQVFSLPDVVDDVVDVAAVGREALIAVNDGVEAIGFGVEQHAGRLHHL